MQGHTFGELYDGREKLHNFFSTRRNQKTRQYTLSILEELIGKNTGIDVRNLLNILVPGKIPNESTFFRILKDLSNPEVGILDRWEDQSVTRRGKAPVFYKLKIALLPTKERPEETHEMKHSEIVRVYGRLDIAIEIIMELKNITRDEVVELIDLRFIEKWGDPERKYARIWPDDED